MTCQSTLPRLGTLREPSQDPRGRSGSWKRSRGGVWSSEYGDASTLRLLLLPEEVTARVEKTPSACLPSRTWPTIS
jgi:hypothetical protein